jgi:hypothetical protein
MGCAAGARKPAENECDEKARNHIEPTKSGGIMETIKIGVCLDHKEALKIYTDAGGAYPVIPPKKNTVWRYFADADGRLAVIINQRGFAPVASDNEEEVNGCLVAKVLDDVSWDVAWNALEKWVTEQLEI